VTSGNVKQDLVFIGVEGSPSGLAIEKTISHVGVAPDLTVSGSAPGDGAVAAITAVSPEGTPVAVAVAGDGQFSFPASMGTWTLEFRGTAGSTTTREVAVGAYPVVVSRPPLDSAGAPARILTRTQRVGFDDLSPSDTLYEMPRGYAGLNWNNWIATHQKLYRGAGYINTAVSSEYIAYNSSGQAATIWSDRPFDFVGTMLGVAWDEAHGSDVIVQAWRGEELVHEDRIRATTAGPVFFDADYRGINRLQFRHERYWQVVLDDFEFRQG
jgi:hypothetical protein